jgi:type I restriction enzyme S subunit
MFELKPYPEYKESGVPWLGKVPKDWEVQRIKTILIELEHRSADGFGNLLSLTRTRGLIRHSDITSKMHSAKTLIGYKKYNPGQIVMNRMQAWSGMFGAGSIDGLVSPDYVVLMLVGNHEVKFILERLKAPDMVEQFAIESKGIGTGFNRLYTDRLGAIYITFPTREEQKRIICFINFMDRRISKLIKAKREIIALLNEQKQAIIHRAVTRGLDPSVPLKDSGVPWLGEIPVHWGVLRSKYVFHEVDDRSTTGKETRMSMSQKLGLIPSSQVEERRLMSESGVGAKICNQGDLVLNRLKAHLGVFALSPQRGLVSPDYTILRPTCPICNRYFELIYRTPACRVELRKLAKGIVQGFWRLYTDDYYDIRIPMPPIKEQENIVTKLELDLTDRNNVIVNTERQIAHLREYRTRLIADVVTGKVDVRAVAESLPDEVDELEEEGGTSEIGENGENVESELDDVCEEVEV